MGVSEIKREIEKYETTINELQKSFMLQREQIIAAIKPFVKVWLKDNVEDHVRKNSEHTKSLGISALSEMKKRLTNLLEDSDNIVDEVFSDDGRWVHVNYRISLNGNTSGQEYNNKETAERNILDGIKIVLGNAGNILYDYKYIPIGREYCLYPNARPDYSRGRNIPAKLIYGYGLLLPQDIQQLINEYRNSIGDLHEASEKLLVLRKNLSEQEAVDLWAEA